MLDDTASSKAPGSVRNGRPDNAQSMCQSRHAEILGEEARAAIQQHEHGGDGPARTPARGEGPQDQEDEQAIDQRLVQRRRVARAGHAGPHHRPRQVRVGQPARQFVLLWIYAARARPRWAVGAMFMILYGCARFFTEYFRVPDWEIHVLGVPLTSGQVLSLPMIVVGIALVFKGPALAKRIISLA